MGADGVVQLLLYLCASEREEAQRLLSHFFGSNGYENIVNENIQTLSRHWEKTNEAISLKFFDPFFVAKRGLEKNRYYHEIGRKKIRRMVYSDPEKLIGRPTFRTFPFFWHLLNGSDEPAVGASGRANGRVVRQAVGRAGPLIYNSPD